MDAPPVQYVKTSDGFSIAYTASGEGQPLVLLPWGLIDMRFAWHAARDWLIGLRQRFRLIQFDARGRGLSSRGLPSSFSHLDSVRDLEAVVKNLGLRDFIIFSNGGFGHLAIRHAASHPERVKALIVGNCPVSLSAFPRSLMQGLSAENWDLFVRSLLPLTLTPEESRIWFENMRECATYSDWQIAQQAVLQSDISRELGQVRVPTLVLHSRNFLLVSPNEVTKLAAGIPGARLMLVENEILTGDATEGLGVIDAFVSELTARRPAQEPLVAALSSREIEVLRLVAAGKSNQQIADELVISINTVRRHVCNVFDKTGVANRTEASLYARDHGLA
jgi:DNA-binding CsgD family transcriptional regulator/pimeloyl-ACP methyl ester carboxylesterase